MQTKDTCRKIQNSFLELCAEQPAQKLKVKDIMEHAGLSKSTFYLNYENLSSLLSEIIDDLTSRVAAPFYRQKPGDNPLFNGDTCQQFIRNLLADRETILLLKAQGALPALLEHLYFFVDRAITNRLRLSHCPNVEQIPNYSELLSQGLLNTLLLHLEVNATEREMFAIGNAAEQMLCNLVPHS